MLKKRSKIEIVADEDVKTKKQNAGLKMLQSMGWSEGRKVGKNPVTYLEEPMELKPRPKGLGLGATPKQLLINQLIGKQNKKVVDKNQIQISDRVKIVAGKHKDIWGVVVSISKDYDELTGKSFQHQDTIISVEINGVPVKVKLKQIQKLEDAAKSNGEVKQPETKMKKKRKKRKKESWVRAGLKVRIVSKGFEKGLHYLKKAIVLDKIGKNCIVQLNCGTLLENLKGIYF